MLLRESTTLGLQFQEWNTGFGEHLPSVDAEPGKEGGGHDHGSNAVTLNKLLEAFLKCNLFLILRVF